MFAIVIAIIGVRLFFGDWNGRDGEAPGPSERTSEPAALLPEPGGAGARPVSPRTFPGAWVTTDDYPSASLRAEEQGTTGFKLVIDEKGRVIDCDITYSSGHARLDATACDALSARADFWPAHDEAGHAVSGSYASSVRWEIPF